MKKLQTLTLTIVLCFCCLLFAACNDKEKTAEPKLTMPEEAIVFIANGESPQKSAYSITDSADIEKIWNALSSDKWESNTSSAIESDDSETIAIDYDTPANSRLVLSAQGWAEYTTEKNAEALYYTLPTKVFSEVKAAISDVISNDKTAKKITLDKAAVNSTVAEFFQDPTLRGSNGDTMDIDCTVNSAAQDLATAIGSPENWVKIGTEALPTESKNIVFLSTDNGNSLILETDAAKENTYITFSYRSELFDYYSVTGDLLTPVMAILDEIK